MKYIYVYNIDGVEHSKYTTKEVYDSWQRGDQDNEPSWYSARPDDATGIVGVFTDEKIGEDLTKKGVDK
jgi:hypothetical protein